MDVVSILRKKRLRASGLEVEAWGSRAVERAIELSETRYCPAIAMVGKAADINSRYEPEEVD